MSNADEEMLDNEREQVLPTTEEGLTTGSEWSNNLPYSPKRLRREDYPPAEPSLTTLPSPMRPSFKHPQTPASLLPKTVPRFAPPQSSHSTTFEEGMTQHRPAFLRSSIASHTSTEPLPEAFSPHRRGQKFVPGGMAATVQQWVIDTGQAATQSRRGQSHQRGEEFVTRVKVGEVKGDGPLVGTAQSASGEAVSVLLAQTVGPSSSRAVDVRGGVVVGIRAPSWEVNVDGRMWTVGVDWKVIS
ncbi:hypothetical protein LTR08_005113 [Meristemomyces frigidus]|nr:hypothetical protein LTR08_005113 [Meristemomyces frigidus]